MAGPISAVVGLHNVVLRDMADIDAMPPDDLSDFGTLRRMQQKPVSP
jgi:hypothetical protein